MNFESKKQWSARLQPGALRRFLAVTAFLAGLIFAPVMVQAATYYVDVVHGNNSWTGASTNYAANNSGKGPWLNFANINYAGPHQLLPGDVVYAMPGVMDHSNDKAATSLFLSPFGTNASSGTRSQPITISNYPGAYFTISNSGHTTPTINFQHCSWIRLFGINSTNAYLQPSFEYCTNCEVAYCNFGGGYAPLVFGGVCTSAELTLNNYSCSNWIHNNVVHDSPGDPFADGGHNLTVGFFYEQGGLCGCLPDYSSYNIIESNVCYHSGHDTLSCYGPSNVVQYNLIHNENFFFSSWQQMPAAHRCMEAGGFLGYGNLIQGNRCQYAGYDYNTPHGLELDGPGTSIIRNNVFSDNDYAGFVIYAGKVSPVTLYWGSNYVYNNTIAKNGFGISAAVLYETNVPFLDTNWVPYQTNNIAVWLPAVALAGTSNNTLVNNLIWDNWSNAVTDVGASTNVAIQRFSSNMFSTNTTLFVDTNDGGPSSATQPNYALVNGSAAIDAGAWLTTITSASSTGNSFTVADPNYFFAGVTAASRTIPGDTIQLQGQFNTTTITGIAGNTITVTTPLTWTNGQGLALAYAGTAPDVGAFEYYAPALTAPATVQGAAQ
jgi:hypothetical protein